MFNNLVLFLMPPMVVGSLEQAAHTFSNLFLGSVVFLHCLAGLCIVVDAFMQGAVEDVETKQKSFVVDGFPIYSGLKCRCLVLLRVFKGTDAKIGCCVFPEILQMLCDVKPSMRQHVSFIRHVWKLVGRQLFVLVVYFQ